MSFISDIHEIAILLPQAIAELKENTKQQKNTQAACQATTAAAEAATESNQQVLASNQQVLDSNAAVVKADLALIALLTAELPVDQPPPAPGAPTIVTVSQFQKEDGSMGFKYGIAPQPLDTTDPNDNDVVKRVVTATNTTQGTPTQTATITQPNVDTGGACYAPGLILQDDNGQPFTGNLADSIALTDQVFDAAGNPSPVESATATIVDTVAPPAPGAIGIQTVAQI